MPLSSEEKLDIKKRAHAPMMWIGIVSIIMFFGGISSAYIVQRADATWVRIFPPSAFFISTIVIVLSSITYWLGYKHVKKGDTKKATPFIGITLLLGLTFVFFQFQGWNELQEKGNYLGGINKIKYLLQDEDSKYGEDYVVMYKGEEMAYNNGQFYDKRDKGFTQPVNFVNTEASNNASSYMFILTGLHVLHLIGGLLSLIVVFIKTTKGKYSEKDHVGVQVSSIYWHFLDFLWLYLLGLLYFVG